MSELTRIIGRKPTTDEYTIWLNMDEDQRQALTEQYSKLTA